MVGYCPICGKPVYFGEKKRSLGRDYHPLCLKCQQCQRQLTPGQHAEHDEKPYCTNCYMKMFGTRAGNRRLMSNCHSSASSSSSSS
ncbi:cysteine-rich protein 2 isoform X6 [Salmo salar]|uniref:Cysteine-rich protein 1 n=2 Tax=Salmo TaxID=8028 RepID=A0A673ZSH8_SALTR|nr:cysteine-rich protein 2-like isoform X1 [Salmo trutta]XP_029602352.1 cysteine-rich protein 2-like isoform X1 [Salmo trutta]XP_045567225.1 cysteine-rich protein 2-like isoform X2 [Salmo salar]XP_045568209.1 cysteine-rich protein 2-like isoform X1 [Salmo salar]XP_045568451.1 cysteine-rich protein 2-like isoform X6 [Salmo salar]